MYNFENCCYVLHQGYFNDILEHRHNFVYYPELSLTLVELVQGRVWQESVITENPWIISCYPQENVYIWRKGHWINPKRETYGASVNIIMSEILLISNTIPCNIIAHENGKILKEKIQNLYK